jgi:hypothetical protein
LAAARRPGTRAWHRVFAANATAYTVMMAQPASTETMVVATVAEEAAEGRDG